MEDASSTLPSLSKFAAAILIILSDWSKNVAYLYAKASVRVGREHQQGHLDNTRERQLEVAGPVPQPGMVEYLFPTDRQITVVSEHVEILVSALVGFDKLDTQVPGFDHLVMEGQVDIARYEARPRSTP